MSGSRPLTKLLLAATFSVDLVAIEMARSQVGSTPNLVSDALIGALYFAQLGLLSIWLVLGTTRWSLRLAAWVVAIAARQLFSWPQSALAEQLGDFVLCAVYGVLVALFTMIVQYRWRYSVTQLLVWSTLTAIIAACARFSDLPVILGVGVAVALVNLAIVPVVAYQLLSSGAQSASRFATLLAICLALSACTAILEDLSLLSSVFGFLVDGMVVGIWILVVSHETRSLTGAQGVGAPHPSDEP